LELIADNKSKTYGQDNPVLTFSVVGLTNGDTKASALTADPTLATTAVRVHRRTATRSRSPAGPRRTTPMTRTNGTSP
jgi:hypothetical protein